MFLLLLFLTFTLFTFSSGNTSSCIEIFPEIEKLYQGVDITKLDYYQPSGLPDGFGKSIFSLTCNQNQTWTSPKGTTFHLPDQILSVVSLPSLAPSGKLPKLDTKLTGNLTHFKKMLAKTGNILQNDEGLFGAFSSTYTYKKFVMEVFEFNKTLAEISTTIATLQVQIKSLAELSFDEAFLEDIKRLPREYEDNATLYDNFVKTYGTHYLQGGTFGGFIFLKLYVKTETLQKEASGDKRALFWLLLEEFYKHSFTSDGHLNKIPMVFKMKINSNSRHEMDVLGGDILDEKGSIFKNWLPTLELKPFLIQGQLRPIEELFSDRVELQRQITKAVMLHRARAYLKDIQNAIQLSSNRSNFFSSKNQQELAQIEKTLQNVSISIEDINKYGNECISDLWKLFI